MDQEARVYEPKDTLNKLLILDMSYVHELNMHG